jgi:hypothetical protein
MAVHASWPTIHECTCTTRRPTAPGSTRSSWFAKIERDCIASGISPSTADLRRKLMEYIRVHNKTCHPFVWKYADTTRRIRVNTT